MPANGLNLSAPAFLAALGTVLSNLTTFTVNGVAKLNGDTINLANGVTSATIAATNGGSITTGPTGDSGLSTGDNSCTFTITAEDGVTTLDVTINLHVIDTGLQEITQVTCIDDVGGSLHNKTFNIRKVGDVNVPIRFNCGARKEKSQFDFTGLTGLDFVTLGAGKQVAINNASGQYAPWFNTGTENDPNPEGGTPEITISAVASELDLAIALLDKLMGAGWLNAGSTGALVIVEDPTVGPRDGAEALTSGAAVSTLATGHDEATTPSGGKLALIHDNDSATVVGAAIGNANPNGWTLAIDEGVVTFTDEVSGPRTGADAGDTGFTVLVTQQGRNPA